MNKSKIFRKAWEKFHEQNPYLKSPISFGEDEEIKSIHTDSITAILKTPNYTIEGKKKRIIGEKNSGTCTHWEQGNGGIDFSLYVRGKLVSVLSYGSHGLLLSKRNYVTQRSTYYKYDDNGNPSIIICQNKTGKQTRKGAETNSEDNIFYKVISIENRNENTSNENSRNVHKKRHSKNR